MVLLDNRCLDVSPDLSVAERVQNSANIVHRIPWNLMRGVVQVVWTLSRTFKGDLPVDESADFVRRRTVRSRLEEDVVRTGVSVA